MITIEMIEEGIRQGIIRIEDTSTLPLSAVEIGTPICRIGDYWFYFAGQEGGRRRVPRSNELSSKQQKR